MLRVTIAETPDDMARGLMFRKSMPDDEGMVFIFKKSQNLRFWGANTYIPLDIAFINRHNRISQISNIKPLCEKPVVSEEECHIAIEANLGFFERNRVKVGDKIDLKKDLDNEAAVEFFKSIKMSSEKLEKFAQSRLRNLWQGIKNRFSRKPIGSQPQPTETQPLPVEQPITEPIQQTNHQPPLPQLTPEQIMESLEDSFDEEEYRDRILPETEEPTPEIPEIQPDEITKEEPIPVPKKEFPEFASPQEAINWAQQNHEVVHIWYTTKGGRDIERDVEPHGIFTAKSTGNPILVTFDETIGDIRAYILDNVMYHQFVDREFQPKFVMK